jgi:uncharacterized protein (DUF2267 family)
VQYDEFVQHVADRAGVSLEHAAMLTQATLRGLADRISGGQAEDLAVQLPEKLAQLLQVSPHKPAEDYGYARFVDNVREMAPDVPAEAVVPGIRAVLLTLRDAVPDKEFTDTMAQLPREFRDLVQEEKIPPQAPLQSGGDQTAGAAVPGGQGAGGLGDATAQDTTAAQDDSLVHRIAERAGVPLQKAVQLAQATLGVLGDRIGGHQAHRLARRLPDVSAEWLDEPEETPAQNYSADDFVSRIRDLTPEVDDDDLTTGIQAVMISLRDAVGDAELEIALEPLSDDYTMLVRVS